LKTCIELSIVDKAVSADYSFDELPILGVYFGIIAFGQIIDPIILRVVFNIGMYSIDALHNRKILFCNLVVVIGLQGEASLRLYVDQAMNPKGKFTQPSVLLLKIVVLHVRRRLQSGKCQF
jgi:hypothetical protein